ncbi:cation diffusion facilitator family transporter [Natronohydrobacter thiooxidans]|uniref:cation diffusion facilitator family transporter n=1 Tax=Natronohydrobacter thiooxidans TaxID=87172 RepID=UPI0008FF3B64|nr:cation diffusion facilitator family transporter [Natronohydrobacter thiooxidans]
MTDFSANSGLPRGLGTWLGMGNRAYKLMVAIGSLITTIVLTLGKLIIGLLSGSLALVADAMQGLIDIVVTGVTVVVVSLSDRGSDPAWTCGREKLEAFAALAEAVLLGIIAVFIWHLAGLKLVHGTPPMQIEAWYLAAAAFAAAADFIRHQIVKRAARATGSMALEANAAHFLTDSLGTVLVTLGLIGAWYGLPVADTLAAFGVAGLLSYTSFTVGRRALGMLLDRIDPTVSLAVLDSLNSIPEVRDVKTLRIRRLPEHHVVDLVAEVEVDSLRDLTRLDAEIDHKVSALLGQVEICAALRPLSFVEGTARQA